MSVPGVALLTYLWHYLFARLLYDHLVRPVAHGDASGLVLLVGVALIAFLLGRRTRRST